MSTISAGTTTTTALVNTGDTTGNLVFQTNGTTTAMTIDTSQNVGIGTSSPSSYNGKLSVKTSDTPAIGYFGGTTYAARLGANAGSATIEGVDAATGVSSYQPLTVGGSTVLFTTGGSERMRIDASGNLGLGVTPSAWGSTWKVIQTNNGYIGNATSNYMVLGGNNYSDSGGTYRYLTTAAANQYQMVSDGSHFWRIAPSGTAGNAISWTQAMTLDASGQLQIGTTTSRGQLTVNRTLTGYGVNTHFYNESTNTAGYCAVLFGQAASGSATGVIGTGGSTAGNTAFQNTFVVGAQSNHPLVFTTNDTERARITSGGEVYIAGTTDQGAYNLQCNGTGVWGAGAYVNGSDQRLKENIQTLTDGLSVVNQLRPVTFQYKADYSKDTNVQPGFIAQELQAALTGKDYVDGVVQAGPEYLNVAYQSLIPVLTKAIQEQQQIIEDLRARVAVLENK